MLKANSPGQSFLIHAFQKIKDNNRRGRGKSQCSQINSEHKTEKLENEVQWNNSIKKSEELKVGHSLISASESVLDIDKMSHLALILGNLMRFAK